MQTMKVENMTNSKGNTVKNQFLLSGENVEIFQSYDSIIAKRDLKTGQVTLDSYYWDYSATTGKYRNQFLGEGIAETRKKIAEGTYKMEDLNNA